MKEELQERLISSLDKIQEYLEATEGFVIEQAPLVAQEIIMLGRMETTWYAVLGTLIAIVLGIIAWLAAKKALKLDPVDPAEGPCWAAAALSGFFSLIAAVVTLFQIVPDMFTVWFAPRLYLIQEISELLR